MKKKSEVILLAFLISLLIVINYPFLNNKLEGFIIEERYVEVTRIIDGDTIEINGNETIRLLGINTPERGEPYYSEAKEFLSDLILNKTIKLEFGKEKKDKYKRTLAYVFLNEANVNKELVDEGYANFYFPSGKDEYYIDFRKAWENCVNSNLRLCKKLDDKCSKCIGVKELNAKDDFVVLFNNCSFSCSLIGWTIKDEGRKKFVFPDFSLDSNKEVRVVTGNSTDTKEILFWKKEDYVWTETGDTLFLRDKEGKLVLWKSY